jgi:flavodoxin
MPEVIYFSRGGNTRKIADIIADELDIKAIHIKAIKSLPDESDIFLGSGLYLLRPGKIVRNFIRNNDFHGKKVALFGTSTTGIGIETIGMELMLKRRGAVITGKYYCPGSFRLRIAGRFFFIRKSRPSSIDFQKAREFTRNILKQSNSPKQMMVKQEEEYENRVLSRI